jgi:hypothetical protein
MLDEFRPVNAYGWEERSLKMLQEHVPCLCVDSLLETGYFVQDLLGLGIGRGLELRLA